MHTPSIVPVELNSILNQNARILSTWFGQIGNKYKATKYCVIAQEFLKGIQEVSKSSNDNTYPLLYNNSIIIVLFLLINQNIYCRLCGDRTEVRGLTGI